VNLGAGDTAVREGDSIAVSTQGLQITRFSRSARTSSALKPARLFRALEIGEEDGDLLTLALERSLGGEDLLGQVLRSVGLGRGEPRLSCYLRNNRLPTLQAELRARGQLTTALRAGQRDAGSALQTELRRRRILVLAPGTLHTAPPPKRASRIASRR